jgi:hypothetical protein
MATKYERKQASFRKQQERLLKQCKSGKAYILKGGYYYMSGWCGYTEFELKAGVYDAVEAFKHVTTCSHTDFIRIVPIDARKHNNMILAEMKRLSTNII